MIHRSEHSENFTVLSNSLIRDSRLSDSALRLLVFMMSCSDDWSFSIKGLVKQLGWPERKVMRLVNELKKAGYIEQVTQFDENGKFRPNSWHIYEDSHALRVSRNASTTQRVNDAKRDSRNASPTHDVKSVDIRNTNIERNTKVKEGGKRFAPPTVDEVALYCQERGNQVDPDAFVNFYTSKGWMVGKNKMKDWKAAVRTWEKDRGGRPQSLPSGNPFLALAEQEGLI